MGGELPAKLWLPCTCVANSFGVEAAPGQTLPSKPVTEDQVLTLQRPRWQSSPPGLYPSVHLSERQPALVKHANRPREGP